MGVYSQNSLFMYAQSHYLNVLRPNDASASVNLTIIGSDNGLSMSLNQWCPDLKTEDSSWCQLWLHCSACKVGIVATLCGHWGTYGSIAACQSQPVVPPMDYSWWRHQMETSPITGKFPAQRPETRSFRISLTCAWTNGCVNNRDAGDLRRHRVHHDVTVMPWGAASDHNVNVLTTSAFLGSSQTQINDMGLRKRNMFLVNATVDLPQWFHWKSQQTLAERPRWLEQPDIPGRWGTIPGRSTSWCDQGRLPVPPLPPTIWTRWQWSDVMQEFVEYLYVLGLIINLSYSPTHCGNRPSSWWNHDM